MVGVDVPTLFPHVGTLDVCASVTTVAISDLIPLQTYFFFTFSLKSLCTWRPDSYISTDEHIGLKQCLWKGNHQGLKQPQGGCISLLHDFTIHVLICQTHALPEPAEARGGSSGRKGGDRGRNTGKGNVKIHPIINLI